MQAEGNKIKIASGMRDGPGESSGQGTVAKIVCECCTMHCENTAFV